MCPHRSSVAVSSLLLHLVFNQFGPVHSKAINGFAGPYIAFGHTFDQCESNGIVDVHFRLSHFRPSRPTELQRVSGNVTSKTDIRDRNFRTEVHMAVWSNNQWKKNAFIFKFPNEGCSALRNQLPSLFHLIAKHHNDTSRIGLDKTKPCLIPQGFAVFDNDPVEWVFPNVPVMPYGHYKFTMRFFDTKAGSLPIMCLEADCEVIPKPF